MDATEYLGDGVYVGHDDYYVFLFTGDHHEHLADNKVFIERDMIGTLVKYLNKVLEERK